MGASAGLRLWSDGRIADAGTARVGPEVPVTYFAMGRSDASNVAIVSLGAERQFDNPARVSVFVGLQSSSAREVGAEGELSVDGVVSSVRSLMAGARRGGARTRGVSDDAAAAAACAASCPSVRWDPLDIDNTRPVAGARRWASVCRW